MADKVTDMPTTAEPLEPGKPVKVPAVSQMGATFAERAGGKAPSAAKKANSTFADRAKAAKRTGSKAVDEDTDGAENKAVAKKAAAKK